MLQKDLHIQDCMHSVNQCSTTCHTGKRSFQLKFIFTLLMHGPIKPWIILFSVSWMGFCVASRPQSWLKLQPTVIPFQPKATRQPIISILSWSFCALHLQRMTCKSYPNVFLFHKVPSLSCNQPIENSGVEHIKTREKGFTPFSILWHRSDSHKISHNFHKIGKKIKLQFRQECGCTKTGIIFLHSRQFFRDLSGSISVFQLPLPRVVTTKISQL